MLDPRPGSLGYLSNGVGGCVFFFPKPEKYPGAKLRERLEVCAVFFAQLSQFT
jgi:hypothetical protein